MASVAPSARKGFPSPHPHERPVEMRSPLVDLTPLRRLSRLKIFYPLDVKPIVRRWKVLFRILNACMLSGKGCDRWTLVFSQQAVGSGMMFKIIICHIVGSLLLRKGRCLVSERKPVMTRRKPQTLIEANAEGEPATVNISLAFGVGTYSSSGGSFSSSRVALMKLVKSKSVSNHSLFCSARFVSGGGFTSLAGSAGAGSVVSGCSGSSDI
jgi:hypothetical protein